MSHLPERDEKNCLNCNARVYGKYCHICGQENLEPGESVWHLVTHFFNDITHFDGKFFSTLKLLITKPGFLSGEYKRGRRASYLNPVRMYIFTSFAFFLIFFALYDPDPSKMTFMQDGVTDEQVRNMDSASFARFIKKVNDGEPMSKAEYLSLRDSSNFGVVMGKDFRDRKEYDSLKLAGVENPGWLMDSINYQGIKIKEKYQGDKRKAAAATLNIFLHNFPQILFLSLPLFAFFLWLINLRKKDFYFVAHGIYSVHLYIFYFITLLLIMGLNWLSKSLEASWPQYIILFVCLGLLFYEYKAMRYFYQQRRAVTILKFILVLAWRFVIFICLFLVFLIFSFLKI